MSLTKKSRQSQRTLAARKRARQAAGQIGPLAKSARATAAQSMHTAREWSAPRIEQAAQSVQRTVAPKVSAALEATAQRIEPAPEKLRDLSRRAQRRAAKAGQDTGRRRAMIIAGVAALFAAALGAVSIVAARRSAGSKKSEMSGNPAADPGMPLGDPESSGVNGQVPAPTSSS